MKSRYQAIATASFAIALSSLAHVSAETVLIDFGNSSSFRGATQTGADANGLYWTSVYSGAYYSNLLDATNTATTLGFGFGTSTGLGTDSYNGPSGATSNPITQTEIDAANINATALGILGGSKASAVDYYTATDGRFVIQGLDADETYNLTFFGSHKFNTVNTTDYAVYSDNTYATSVGSTSLSVGVGSANNTSNTATIAGLTPQTANTFYVRFGASGYTANGYINELSIVGYVPYTAGGTTTLAAAKTYTGNTILGGASTLNANAAGAMGGGSSVLQIDAGGGTLSLGANQTVAALIGSGNLALTTGANTLTLNPGGTTSFKVDTSSNGNYTSNDYSGVLSGSGTISKTGNGTQTFSGGSANTFTGTTAVTGGTLILNKTAGVDAIAGNITLGDGVGGDVLQLAADNQIANTSIMTMVGTAAGARGWFQLNGKNETIGGLSSATAGAGLVANESNASNSILTLDVTGSQAFSGLIRNGNGTTGTLALVKNGSGTQTISGTNSYTGTTTVNGGTLVIAGNQTGGGQIVLYNAGSVLQFGDGTSTNGSAVNVGTVYVNSTGKVNLFKTDGGSFANQIASNPGASITLSGTNATGTANTFSGTIWSNGGTLNTLSTNAGAVLAFSNASAIDIKGTTLNIDGAGDTLITGAIYNSTGTGIVAKNGTGTLIYQFANTYSGETDINAGAIRVDVAPAAGGVYYVGNGGATATAASLLLGGGGSGLSGGVTFNRNVIINNGDGSNRTLGGTNTSGTNTFSGTIAMDGSFGENRSTNLNAASGGTVAFTNTISGAGQNITKAGGGTVILSGANSYSGNTTVNAGTLLINNTSGSGTGTGNVSVTSGATLGGTGTVSGAVTVTGKIAPGSGGIGTLNTGAVTWNGAATAGVTTNWEFALGSGNSADKLNISGNFSKGIGSVFNFDFLGSTFTGIFTLAQWSGSTSFAVGDFSYSNLGGGHTGTFTINGTTKELQFTAVPEPSSALAGLMLGAGLLRRRRRA